MLGDIPFAVTSQLYLQNKPDVWASYVSVTPDEAVYW